MPVYAHLNEQKIVTNIILADEEFIQSLPDKENWVYGEKTFGLNWHRANMGFLYDENLKAFLPPKPWPSWVLDSDHNWQPPVPYPETEGEYVWDENTKTWQLYTGQ